MGYDNSKDACIKTWALKDEKDEKKIIYANIYSYDGGAKKLSLSRSYEKNGNIEINGKIGRMTIDEVKWLKDNIDQIINDMQE